MHRVTLCFFETGKNELRRQPSGFSKWTQADIIFILWMHIFTCLLQFIQNSKKQRGIEIDALQLLVLLSYYLCTCCQGLRLALSIGRLALQGFIMDGYSHFFGFGQMDFYTALYVGNWLFLSLLLSSQAMSLLCLPHICRLPLGLISSGRAEAVGHSISTLCMLSVPAFPFFSKGCGNNLSCPPARRKWVTDNPWTFPRGFSVAQLQGHWLKLSGFIAAPKPTSKQLCAVCFLSKSISVKTFLFEIVFIFFHIRS